MFVLEWYRAIASSASVTVLNCLLRKQKRASPVTTLNNLPSYTSVLVMGLKPICLSTTVFKTVAYVNSATPA